MLVRLFDTTGLSNRPLEAKPLIAGGRSDLRAYLRGLEDWTFSFPPAQRSGGDGVRLAEELFLMRFRDNPNPQTDVEPECRI